jgi:phage baseplate assembly protein gpV
MSGWVEKQVFDGHQFVAEKIGDWKTTVIFQFGDGTAIECQIVDGRLDVRACDGTLAVRPRVANVVTVDVEGCR